MLTIDDLPDDVLLEIFDFYVDRSYQDLRFHLFNIHDKKRVIESWKSLVHVCRQWRGLVFESPRRLNLQLFYKFKTDASKRVFPDVWPALPFLIEGDFSETLVDNDAAVLEHSDRIRQINLNLTTTFQLENLWTAMQVPFPQLEVLYLSFERYTFRPMIPDSFLGGSAPRLRYLTLYRIPYLGLPKIILSATHLVHLSLLDIPRSGFITSEAIASCLSMLINLEKLSLRFYNFSTSAVFSPDQESRRPPPPTRSVLPALTKFSFQGPADYFEDLVARIDTPRLDRLLITFFGGFESFDLPELIQFISRTPAFGAYDEACIDSFDFEDSLLVRLQSHPWPSEYGMIEIKDLWSPPAQQLPSLAQICSALSLRLLLTVENLYIEDLYSQIEGVEWLDLLLPFPTVKNLYLSWQFSPPWRIPAALQELTEGRATQVLPALQNVFLEGFLSQECVQEGISRFLFERQLTNYPFAISVWDRDPKQEMLQLVYN
jgi:hypothetical protein